MKNSDSLFSPSELAGSLCRNAEDAFPVFAGGRGDIILPSKQVISEISEDLRKLIFPGFFSERGIPLELMEADSAINAEKVYRKLKEQIRRGFCFKCCHSGECSSSECEGRALDIASMFMAGLPSVQSMLIDDARAAYSGDPAASSAEECIFSYPGLLAVANYRIANALYRLGVPIIPRIMTELAHSVTGIDIHPGASIGRSFFIDHGTGVVIGETCIIGSGCRLYQGVTLGAKTFREDSDGNLVKGLPRHPILGDCVTVYAGATILGRITIGSGAVIGGNMWITEDVPPGKTMVFRH